MAEIAPLTPLRYDPDKLPGGLASVVAPPYDVINAAQRAELAARDPHNVVRLILPEGEGEARYANAAALLAGFRASKVLVRDPEPAYYRYDQTFTPPGDGQARPITRRGFLALVKVVPFSARIVLPHERTLSGPKEDRLKLFRATQTNLSPGFMLYRDPANALRAPLQAARPIAEFRTQDGIQHALAKVSDAEAVRAITAQIAASSLLIADGHHRYETALRYAGEVDAPSPRSESKYFMTFLVNGDDPELVVFPTHRFVHSLPSFSVNELLALARETFEVRLLAPGASAGAITQELRAAGAKGPALAAAAATGEVAILALRKDVDLARHPTLGQVPAVLRRTDVALLHAGILEHLLGITREAQAARTNLLYPQDTAGALGDLRAGKGQVLFVMNATPVAHVREVAEAGEVMPQKSTFFYPKVLTGLAIHTLEKDRLVAAS